MKTLAIINQKGGVGKTTLAINLAYYYAKNGYKTLIIDGDAQANTSAVYAPGKTKNYLEDLLIAKKNIIDNCIYSAEVNNEVIKNLYIISTTSNLSNCADVLNTRLHRETILSAKLDKIKKQFDICIIDCMPSISILTINAIYASDKFIVPILSSRYAVSGLGLLLDTIEEVKQSSVDIEYHFVKNIYDKTTSRTNNYIAETLSEFNQYICKSTISKCELINQAHINCETIYQYAPKSKSITEYNKLAKEIM